MISGVFISSTFTVRLFWICRAKVNSNRWSRQDEMPEWMRACFVVVYAINRLELFACWAQFARSAICHRLRLAWQNFTLIHFKMETKVRRLAPWYFCILWILIYRKKSELVVVVRQLLFTVVVTTMAFHRVFHIVFFLLSFNYFKRIWLSLKCRLCDKNSAIQRNKSWANTRMGEKLSSARRTWQRADVPLNHCWEGRKTIDFSLQKRLFSHWWVAIWKW